MENRGSWPDLPDEKLVKVSTQSDGAKLLQAWITVVTSVSVRNG